MNTSLVSSSSVFNFNATHNGIQCIQSLKPEDQGTEHQFWFTRQMLREVYGVKSEDTITNHVDALIKRGVITVAKNLATVQIANSVGAVNITTIFDLKVFNHLGMRLDTDRAWEMKAKFNDILVKEETKQDTLPAVSKEDQIFLTIIHADNKEQTALALNEYKKFRDRREQEIAFERDEAIRTKACISSKREATLMVAKREDNKKINKLTCENTELKEQNEILKVSLGESHQWMSSAQLIQNFKLHCINGKIVKPKTLTTMLKKCGCRHRESEFPDKSGFNYTIFFVEDVKKALNIF